MILIILYYLQAWYRLPALLAGAFYEILRAR